MPVATSANEMLEQVLAGPSLLDAMAAGAQLTAAARTDALRAPALCAGYDAGDPLARLLLLPALAATGEPRATARVVGALAGGDRGEQAHAAWALADVPPVPAAAASLVRMQAAGGFSGMLAELALEPRRGPRAPHPGRPRRGRRMRIAQVVMQGWIDPGLTRSGAGDAGGLTTLAVRLAEALAARPEVEEVVTLARGAGGPEQISQGARIERVPVGGDGSLASSDAWPHRRELEHGL